MNDFHLVIGSGPVGTRLASTLAADHERVVLASHSGAGPELPGVTRLAVDAKDPAALTRIATGAEVIYNCASPGGYQHWDREWPRLAGSILQTARTVQAVLVTSSNLYSYGRPPVPLRHDSPERPSDHKGELRLRLWRDALAAHESGDLRATEARAADYIGPTIAPNHGLLPTYARSALAGSTVRALSDPEQPHSWAYIPDVAETLKALGSSPLAWGRPWLVPVNEPLSIHTVLRQITESAGKPPVRIKVVPRPLLALAGRFSPLLRETLGVLDQFDNPLVVDAAETTRVLGVTPSPWDTVVSATAAQWAKSSQ
ncbi:NAD-dependent epimerase/dehydratase family protein [Arthrobacter sp. NPDC090010]|uniref:NAD-dependent epimerase/dehydratase family protein n=1 Tax=Arthrobacter sp. NPDC090010 TaxID=3363942 RepID=UPI003819F798